MAAKKRSRVKRSRQRGAKKSRAINTMPLYVALVIVFIGYFLLQNVASFAVILGALIFFLIIAALVLEISNGFREEGYKKNTIEIIVAIGIVLIIWVLLRVVLNTPYPLDVVPSCSMLPALNRGDMILLQGVNKNNIVAPVVNVTSSEWNLSFANVNTEALQCVAYNQTPSGVKLSQIMKPGYSIGLLADNGGNEQIIPPSKQNGLLRYTCGMVGLKLQNGTVASEVSTTAITIANTTITGDKNNSIIVYQTSPQDEFYKLGDSYIVHRIYALVNVSGTYYSLTKGDNNPGLDVQFFNTPANISQIGGKVIGSVPYIGYLKLILSNNFVEPTGCNYTTEN